MSFVIERDGLAACPDDPARVAAPDGRTEREEINHLIDLVESQEWHFARVKPMVVATLAGEIPFCPALLRDSIQKMEASDLWDVIMGDVSGSDHAKMLAGLISPKAKAAAEALATKLIDAYCDEAASFLAKCEVGE